MSRIIALLAAASFVAGASVVDAQAPQPTALPPAKTVASAKSLTVQNDRASAVTLHLASDRLERAIGTVEAGALAVVELPSWATRGQKTLVLNARAEGERSVAATYSLPLSGGVPLGLLVPPRGGLPRLDSVLVAVPAGAADKAIVSVANERSGPVQVFAEQGLLFVTLGEVAAKSQVSLVLPTSLTARKGAIRVFTRAGVFEKATKALDLKNGDRISVIVM